MRNAIGDDELELYIAEPCSKAWDELAGNDARRFCSDCSLYVIHGSSLTRREAIRLVQGSPGRVCMRLELDATGAQEFRPEAPAVPLRSAPWITTASAAILAACARTESEPPQVATPAVVEASIAPGLSPSRDEPTVLDPLPVETQQRKPVTAVESSDERRSRFSVPCPTPVVREHVVFGRAAVVRRKE